MSEMHGDNFLLRLSERHGTIADPEDRYEDAVGANPVKKISF